jgi:phage/plasmid-associated DNA primase
MKECSAADDAAGSGTMASAVYMAYQRWAQRNGHRPLSWTKFGMRMRSLGKSSRHVETGNVYPVTLLGGSREDRYALS